jgi:predicted RNase H-like HicB family nuclease
MRFALALHTDDGVKYGVTVPDLPGCFSAGDSFDEAVEMAREAIDAHCELLAEKGLDIPSPQPLAHHQADPDLAGAVWVVIDVNVEQYLGRAENINITVPARLLRRIDDYAKRHGESRSGFLTRAAVQAMGSEGEGKEIRSGER